MKLAKHTNTTVYTMIFLALFSSAKSFAYVPEREYRANQYNSQSQKSSKKDYISWIFKSKKISLFSPEHPKQAEHIQNINKKSAQSRAVTKKRPQQRKKRTILQGKDSYLHAQQIKTDHRRSRNHNNFTQAFPTASLLHPVTLRGDDFQHRITLFFNEAKQKSTIQETSPSTQKPTQKIEDIQISRAEKKISKTPKNHQDPRTQIRITQNTFPKKANVQEQLQEILQNKSSQSSLISDPNKEHIVYVMLRTDLRHAVFGLPQYYPGHPQILTHLPSEKDAYDDIDAYKEYKHRPFSTVEKSWKLKEILIDDGFCHTKQLPERREYCKLKASTNRAKHIVAETIYRDAEIAAYEGKHARPYCSVKKKYLYIKQYKTYYRYKTNLDLQAAAWIFKPELDEHICPKGTPYYIIPERIAKQLI